MGLTIPPRLQFPTFGYDRTTCGKKPMLQSNCSAYLMGTISLSLMSLTSIRIVRITLTLYSRLSTKMLSYRSTRAQLGLEQLYLGPFPFPSRQRPRPTSPSHGAPRNRRYNQVVPGPDSALRQHPQGVGVWILYAGRTQGGREGCLPHRQGQPGASDSPVMTMTLP